MLYLDFIHWPRYSNEKLVNIITRNLDIEYIQYFDRFVMHIFFTLIEKETQLIKVNDSFPARPSLAKSQIFSGNPLAAAGFWQNQW